MIAAPTTSKPGLFLGICVAFLVVAVHYAAIRATGTYLGADPSTVLAVSVLPAVITLWILPPARKHGLLRWPVLWFLYMTSAFPVVVLVVGETWILYRFFAVDFPGQHKWATHDEAPAKTVATKRVSDHDKAVTRPADRQAKK